MAIRNYSSYSDEELRAALYASGEDDIDAFMEAGRRFLKPESDEAIFNLEDEIEDLKRDVRCAENSTDAAYADLGYANERIRELEAQLDDRDLE